MLAPVLFATLIALAPLSPPAPSPVPTTLPFIFHGVVSPICSAMQSAIMPIGYVSKVNDAAIRAMAASTRKFLRNVGSGDSHSAVNSLYGPAALLAASRVDAVAQQIFENVTREDGYMNQSRKATPVGRDAKLDALRRRAQDLIDVQLALANKYEDFASNYLDNQGMGDMTTETPFLPTETNNNQSNLTSFETMLSGQVLKNTYALAGGTRKAPYRTFKSAGDLIRYGTSGELTHGLHAEELAFSLAIIGAFNECRGTKFTVEPPSG